MSIHTRTHTHTNAHTYTHQREQRRFQACTTVVKQTLVEQGQQCVQDGAVSLEDFINEGDLCAPT
jgi:hypothetical protein